MSTFMKRLFGALRLDPATFEEVEADRGALGQAFLVILLAALAGGVGGDLRVESGGTTIDSASHPRVIWIAGVILFLLSWALWAGITAFVGTKLLPEKDTSSDTGELMRVLGFATAPGIFNLAAYLPGVGPFLGFLVQLWLLAAMVVAVRQALDYKSTWRAIGVCVIGFIPFVLSLVLVMPFVLALVLVPLVGGG